VSPRTPKQLADAIGAAKELTEATLRGALDRLGEPWTRNDDLQTLMKKWRRRVEDLAPPHVAGREALDRVQGALGNLVTFLATWRNTYGSGHGRPRYPPGLKRPAMRDLRQTRRRWQFASSQRQWTILSFSRQSSQARPSSGLVMP
jgi:hypothetical protein